MASTFTPIQSYTLTSDQTSVDFTSISGYTDLFVSMYVKNNIGNNYNIYVQFNSSTSNIYSDTYVYGTGSVAGSSYDYNTSSVNRIRCGFSNNSNFNTNYFHILNYANTTTWKTVLCQGADINTIILQDVGQWRSTSAITSVNLTVEGGNKFATGSQITIYGIKAA